MALVKCPECGHTVSDKAVACPGCGYPICSQVTDSQGQNVQSRVLVPAPVVQPVPKPDLKSDKPICPLCGNDSSIEKVSAIVRQGTATSVAKYSGSAEPPIGDGLLEGLVTGRFKQQSTYHVSGSTRTTVRTRLAEQLGEHPSPPGYLLEGAGYLLLILVCLASLFFTVAVLGSGSSSSLPDKVLQALVGLAASAAAGYGLFRWWRWSENHWKRGNETYVQHSER